MAPNDSCKGKEKATARATMPTSVINRRLSLDGDCMKGFISDHIRGLIWIFNVSGVKDGWAGDLFNGIIILDPVRTCHYSRFQLLWHTAGAGVRFFGSGGQPSAHTWGKYFTKPVTKWTVGGGTNAVPSEIKSIAPIQRQPALGRLKAPVSVSLGMVAMISRQWLSHQAGGSTCQATSWLLDH